MSDKSGKKSGKAVLLLALLAAALCGVYIVYGEREFSDLMAVKDKIFDTRPNKAVPVKKPDRAGKDVNNILGGPEFENARPGIQQASLRVGDPEPPAKEPLSARLSKSGAADAAPSGAPAPVPLPSPPPPRELPSFPKTNTPTLNFTLEMPPPPKQPEPAQVAAPPPPPPPPPKPRATLTLSNVSGHLSDRADINVSMSIEITYEAGNALREELEFKRDLLSTVAGSVLKKHEYGAVNTVALKADILAAFNGQLHSGKLNAVEIRDLQVGQAMAGN
ncbi:MAG: hypothetical protein LBB74_07390 [Chitinispirillales bacterium]|jgi:hypothetical protein|nr:hypothetical protein [Chitinispirillales bacterium]